MLTADTNVWARALLNDNQAETKIARSTLVKARSSDGVFVPLIVFAELSWVLRARWERERVLNALDGLLRARGVTVESPALARKALEAAQTGPVGLADHLIAEVSFDAGVREILTFDKAFARLPRVRRLS
ncbi:MAG TPA: PIN domain-containing protein [Acidobacteriaceae bacterium]|nr:PIN domain-containing protein [Acidobacteriaceae bacterium]